MQRHIDLRAGSTSAGPGEQPRRRDQDATVIFRSVFAGYGHANANRPLMRHRVAVPLLAFVVPSVCSTRMCLCEQLIKDEYGAAAGRST